MPVSVIIISRNEEQNIRECICSAKLISGDIIVVDTGSFDNTVKLAKDEGARVITSNWEGYGASKNKGAEKAKYDWIFSLDADERISPGLAESINKIDFENGAYVYQFKRANFLGKKRIKFGADGFDKVTRIYHRRKTEWDLTRVHEKLVGTGIRKKIPGLLIHYSSKKLEDYREKLVFYAGLSAIKYFENGKKANFVKRFLAPAFNALKSYIFQLGFLDGLTGLKLAELIFYYTRLKYHYLFNLNKEQSKMDNVANFKADTSITHSSIAFLRK